MRPARLAVRCLNMQSEITVFCTELLGAPSGTPAELMALIKVLITASLIALAVIVVGGALRRARGTTLVAPLIWALISLLTVTTAFIWQVYSAARINLPSEENWWLIAICSTFCPLVSLLGAKRPQHKAWQWIVTSFWIIASLPAIQALALQPGEPLTVPIVWRWFYVVVLLIGAVNYLPTRYAIANLLFTVGQTDVVLALFAAGARGHLQRRHARYRTDCRSDLLSGVV